MSDREFRLTQQPLLDSQARSVAPVIKGLLDDFEDGDLVSLQQESDLFGYWYTFDDKLECDNPNPSAGMTDPVPQPVSGMDYRPSLYADYGVDPAPAEHLSCNSWALRLSGGGHALWGMGVGMALSQETTQSFDLRAEGFNAVRFWTKNAVPDQTIDVDVVITDVYAEPAHDYCVPRDEAVCNAYGCHDSPRFTVRNVGPDWQLVEIPFEYFRRRGTGIYDATKTGGEDPPLTLSWDLAVQLQFMVKADAVALWIDNVAFVERP